MTDDDVMSPNSPPPEPILTPDFNFDGIPSARSHSNDNDCATTGREDSTELSRQNAGPFTAYAKGRENYAAELQGVVVGRENTAANFAGRENSAANAAGRENTAANAAGGFVSAALPPLAPKTKRAIIPSKLRAMIRRTTSETSKCSSSDGEERDGLEEIPAPPSLATSGRVDSFIEIPMSPGRQRIFTIDQTARRGSFIAPALEKLKAEGGMGMRRRSVRLSEADVGLLLNRVSKISPETLRQASLEGNSSLCEALVRGGVSVDDSDARGRTPLMLAALNGKSDTVSHLIMLGALLDVKDDSGMTALALAVEAGKLSVVRTLADANCNRDAFFGNEDEYHLLTLGLEKMEKSLTMMDERAKKSQYYQTAEVCRVLMSGERGATLPLQMRDRFAKPTLFLVDEWTRAKTAGEELVLPPMDKIIAGEKTLVQFLMQHRHYVNLMTTIKIWFVVVFIVFDLAMRELTMTPSRLLTYVVLYVGAYYL